MVRFNVRNVLTMEIFRQKGSDMEEKHQTLKELPVSERPYEKCEKNGTAMLSDAELLAVILRSGTKDQTAIDLATKDAAGWGSHPPYCRHYGLKWSRKFLCIS